MQDKLTHNHQLDPARDVGDVDEGRNLQDDRMTRALQLAKSSPTHRAAFDANPVSYLQNLGVDTRGMTPSKLGVSKETLAQVSQGFENKQFTWTPITVSNQPPPAPTSLPPSVTATVTATCSFTVMGPNTQPPSASVTVTD
jgi:hypothetical protein